MKLIRGLHNVGDSSQACVLTIGNFDGVHVGHQQVLTQLKDAGQRLGLPTRVMIFEPQPTEFFTPEKAQARLTRLREKLLAFQQYGVESVIVMPFSRHFSESSPQEFIEKCLVGRLGVRYLVIGDDFHFGHHREGNFSLLQEAGTRYGFDVVKMETVFIHGRRVSSTWIREVLAQGDLRMAEQLLGRPYCMCGRIAYGDQLGRELGFPTANIYLHRHLSPLLGIYAVKVRDIGKEPILGVAYVGNRPTVKGTRSLLEVYLFKFDKNIYGHYVEVDFLHKIRDDQHFESLDLLKEQIAKDVVKTQDFFEGPLDDRL